MPNIIISLGFEGNLQSFRGSPSVTLKGLFLLLITEVVGGGGVSWCLICARSHLEKRESEEGEGIIDCLIQS